jgi:nucleoside-diphosphate-sugar epimerase
VGFPVLRGDAISGQGLTEAFEGIDVAYFLIHSMEAASNGAFAAAERRAAENFARAAADAGVQRIVYLGGPVPGSGRISPHLSSRHAVEEIMLAAVPCGVAFRASIVIGAQNRTFRFLVRLVERLPVLALPAWRTHRTAPIDERDMIELLARAATAGEVCGQSLDAVGPEVVTYGQLIDRLRHHMLLSRPEVAFKRLTVTPIASRISAIIAGEDHSLIGPLMESLEEDLLPRDDRAARLLGVRLHSLDAAIERALREWETIEPLAAR